MSVNIPTETEAGGGGQQLPMSGMYEVVSIDTDERVFDERAKTYLVLSLLGEDEDSEIEKVSYSYSLTRSGKLNSGSNAGRLRGALDNLDPEGEMGIRGSWEITGQKFYFEVEEITIDSGPRAGVTYQVFLPTSLAEVGRSVVGGSDNGYTSEGMAALLTLLDEPKPHATIFKEAGKVEAIRKDDKLYNDIVTQKAFSRIPGIQKIDGKYVFVEAEA